MATKKTSLSTQVAALTAQLAALTAASSPAAPSVAAAHWKARDVACPRACGRSNFRTVGGANGTHRTPKGGVCKA